MHVPAGIQRDSLFDLAIFHLSMCVCDHALMHVPAVFQYIWFYYFSAQWLAIQNHQM